MYFKFYYLILNKVLDGLLAIFINNITFVFPK